MTTRSVLGARFSLVFLLTVASGAQDLRQSDKRVNASFFWRTTTVADHAELLTLFVTPSVRSPESAHRATIPVLAVLRDSLGDPDHQTDRIRYVWLLSSSRPGFQQQLLSALPFFHWHVGTRKSQEKHLPKPLLNLRNPTHELQQRAWETAILRVASGVPELKFGAKVNPFFANRSDHNRRRASEALSLLRRAPSSEEPGDLSSSELDMIIGRVLLSTTTTGGLAAQAEISSIKHSKEARRDIATLRNLELLRLSAERVGLYFEPLALGEQTGLLQGARYGLLWSPVGGPVGISGASVAKTWQILQISDPAKHVNVSAPAAYRQTFSVDRNGALLPDGEKGESTEDFVPVALYSLTYPRMPLLLIDFLHPARPRRREINQRVLGELVRTGSYFSPVPLWALSGALGAYYSLKSHQGSATDGAARLECYAEAQMDLALDHSVDAEFRSDMQHRLDSIDINPLNSSIDQELASANASYTLLLESLARSGGQIDEDRRRELAAFGAGRTTLFTDALAHYATFRQYTRRASAAADTLESTKRIRRVQDLMDLLRVVTRERVQPEVSFDARRIEDAVQELSILTETSPLTVRQTFMRLTRDLAAISRDPGIRSECLTALGGDTVTKSSIAALARANSRPGL
ncbi:MAG: hypothetical protein ACJ746_01850 [Bryobacteraceae bacterium]